METKHLQARHFLSCPSSMLLLIAFLMCGILPMPSPAAEILWNVDNKNGDTITPNWNRATWVNVAGHNFAGGLSDQQFADGVRIISDSVNFSDLATLNSGGNTSLLYHGTGMLMMAENLVLDASSLSIFQLGHIGVIGDGINESIDV